ncbi:BMA_0021/BMA_0022 family TOMM bacteriocin [Polyangium sp. 15x6]|uniref:BMA_0021/BMA_0022 family TOMM bacteriocin n=1 Tax=Polyangium sp. 15x6 TaxID=3042687 RepID=UPI00249A5F78|nr:BMA_0021/BMA_0022 family TOMM bacteriocin [Polyangium sp. 15x6]MDI3291373.1 BMA_0021/BMA_0022 family TOMM bacteriocin [Polyangium sp. 15x6]
MTRKGDLVALAAVALALSSTASAAETEEREAPEGESATESEPVSDFSELWVRVITKAWNDETFKRELLADPAKALEAHFNYQLPPDVQLEIVESQPRQPAVYKITLPAMPARAGRYPYYGGGEFC